MDPARWVVSVTEGTRHLGRFPFPSRTEAEKFMESAVRHGFRARFEVKAEPSTPPSRQ